MRRLIATVGIVIFSMAAAGCGPSSSEQSAATAGPTVSAGPTATPIVLATPTPRPAPPTPTLPPPSAQPPSGAATPEPTKQGEAAPMPGPAVTAAMVDIPAGPFTMGSDQGAPEDAPAHQVDVPAFKMDKFEVTNADFAAFVKATGYQTYAERKGLASWKDQAGVGKDNHPVTMVTWDDAAAYCKWAGQRLPSEAEWEKAARGTDGRAFPWGNDWDPAKANVKDAGLRGTAAVGSFGAGASPYGVEDMAGNVWEWTADWYQPYPGNTAKDNYYGEKFRVTRGGGWFDEQPQATTFNRNAADPAKTANDDLGFRCAQ